MDLKRLTRMFLRDFHKKHFLRVWRVGNLASIDQIHLVNYFWFYNATGEEGTEKFWREKQYSLYNCLLWSKIFDAPGYFNNILDPLPGLTIKRQFIDPVIRKWFFPENNALPCKIWVQAWYFLMNLVSLHTFSPKLLKCYIFISILTIF